MTEKKILAIIPARGGSKRLPGKNIRQIAGKPLITWTIDAGLKSKYISRLIVSTDNSEIADTARTYGCEVPFMRPERLSEDNTSSFDVIENCIEFLKNNEKSEYDFVVLLQPTSPLRSANNIDKAIELLFEKNGKAVISVCETEHSPLWSNTLEKNLSMHNFLKPEYNKTPSQQLPEYYRLNGAIYICEIKSLLKEKNFFLKDNIYAYIMSKKESIDIDDQIDFDLAELYLKDQNK
ncbi:cytidylyltransferase domain-containing protein [Bacteroidota bacterium]